MRDAYDQVDRALVHALQLHARAPFRLLGQVVGISDQTAARRYAKLRRAGALRVVGVSGSDLLRRSQWIIRVKTAPAAVKAVGAALAAREDTSWVNLCGAGTDIVFAGVGDSAEVLISDTLAHTKAIISIEADRVLHTFSGGHASAYTKRGPLTPEQVAQVLQDVPRRGETGPAERSTPPDAVDQRLLRALQDDGRASVDALAKLVGLSDTSTRRRVDALLRTGALRIAVDVDVSLLGVPLRALLWLRTRTGTLQAAGDALATHTEVTYVAAVTGAAGLFVSIAVEDAAALYRYLSTRLPDVPGIDLIETTIVLRHLKAAGSQLGS